MYLIKGDIVKLLNEEYLIEYPGKKMIRKYINSDDIEILQKHTYIHIQLRYIIEPTGKTQQ